MKKGLEWLEDGLKSTGRGAKKVWKRFTVKNTPAITKTIAVIKVDKLPKNVKEIYQKYERAGWKGNVSGQTPETKAGKVYDNDDRQLPQYTFSGKPIKYIEFDVNHKTPGQN